MPKILLLSRYEWLGASSRYRFYQYLPYLQQRGFDITVVPLLNNQYLQLRYAGRSGTPDKIIQAYVQRVLYSINLNSYDLIWLEKEVFPWLPFWLEKLLFGSRRPYVVDYDDAWFHRYNTHRSGIVRWLLKGKMERIARRARLVIAGNNYLARWATQAGADWVEIVPTTINLARYPVTPPPDNKPLIIGWIGTPVTARYFDVVHKALKTVCLDGTARVVALGAGHMQLEGVPLTTKPWSENSEVVSLQSFDVGIMPLWDTTYEQGKCGLKLLQYMATARPVVGSPVGVNQKIIEPGANGFFAKTPSEWVAALQELKSNEILRRQMGQAGRTMVEKEYSLQANAPRLTSLLLEAAAERR